MTVGQLRDRVRLPPRALRSGSLHLLIQTLRSDIDSTKPKQQTLISPTKPDLTGAKSHLVPLRKRTSPDR